MEKIDHKSDQSAKQKILKYLSLILLIIQFTSISLLIRYTRKKTNEQPDSTPYLSSVVVMISEIIKLLICSLIVLDHSDYSYNAFFDQIYRDIFSIEFVKMIVPAFLFNFQNNLSFLALTYLDAATYQILSQIKILTTALISIIILKTKLDFIKWSSLFMLVIGVSIIEFQKIQGNGQMKYNVNGLAVVILMSLSSGFSTVYFEKLLKSSSITIWMRNVQLSIFGVFFGLLNVFILDGQKVADRGILQGFNNLVWIIVFLSAFGGLLIAAVIAYADNIIKGFAMSLSIMLSSIISIMFLNDLKINLFFVVGSTLIISSTFLYSYRRT